jgi:hypothetical protein
MEYIAGNATLIILASMSLERQSELNFLKPYEAYGFTGLEISTWNVKQVRFEEIIEEDRTFIFEIRESSNIYGEFLFVTTIRPRCEGRVAMTFFGLGHNDHRERWITGELFWYQTSLEPN